MLTATAISNPVFLQSVRRGMRMAGIRAVALGARVTVAKVRNRKGAPVLDVVFYKCPANGRPCFEFIDSNDRDVTQAVRAAFTQAKEA